MLLAFWTPSTVLLCHDFILLISRFIFAIFTKIVIVPKSKFFYFLNLDPFHAVIFNKF